MKKKINKAIILDRDGVINKKMPEGDYVKSWKDFKFLPGAKQAIALFNKNGFAVFVFTNQRGVSKGLHDHATLKRIHNNMKSALKNVGGYIEKIYYCPHGKQEKCNCRKPKPGMILNIQEDFKIRPQDCWVVGDRLHDIQAAKKAGSYHTALIQKGTDTTNHADISANSLLTIAKKITKN